MYEFFIQPWPWWFSGIIIGLIVPGLYLLAGKGFGISTSFQEIGSICIAGRGPSYLRDFDWRAGLWTLVFAFGIGLGGFVATQFMSFETNVFLPSEFRTTSGAIKLLSGGFLIGFGTRYAGGCTSGHAINGIANLNWPSMLATVCFFVGGIGVTWGIGSLLFSSVK